LVSSVQATSLAIILADRHLVDHAEAKYLQIDPATDSMVDEPGHAKISEGVAELIRGMEKPLESSFLATR
jgi:hypothetical protein